MSKEINIKNTGLISKIVYSKMTSTFLLFFLSASILMSLWFNHKLSHSQKQRYLSYVAADELRQSSDDLTRMVRTYVATKDPRYEKMYWDILAIRNGDKARPLRYENIYWDFIAFTNEKPRPDGQKIPLYKIMEDLEFTQKEFEKLAEAEMYSNNLVRKEMLAMHAIKGEFLDAQGKFTIRGEPDYDYAQTLMNDESYHSDKVDIMTPIDEFFVMVNARTEAQVSRDTIYTYIFISLAYLTIPLLLGLSRVSINKLKRTEKERELTIVKLENKSRDLENEIEDHRKAEDALRLQTEQLEKTNKAFVGRELRMVDLKKEIEELKKMYKT